MEVTDVDGAELAPEKGMVRQILDAFADSKAPATIALIALGTFFPMLLTRWTAFGWSNRG